MALPVVGRLSWQDYCRLTLAIFILLIEGILRFIVRLIPTTVIDFLRYCMARYLLTFSSAYFVTKLSVVCFRFVPQIFKGSKNERIKEMDDSIVNAKTTPQLIKYHGYGCEEHVVLTADGYYLVLYRIIRIPNTNADVHGAAVSNGSGYPSPQQSTSSTSRRRSTPTILVLHGAIMCSEIWVCHRNSRKNIVCNLADEGYDVWLANRRGCKYSQKHTLYKPDNVKFWDFSMDETIIHDVPAQIEYVLGVTGNKSLTLMGFSQGAAEIFGALSVNRRLEKRVDCVVAFSATAKPPTPKNALIHSMVHWTPEIVYLLFGRKSLLSSVYFWQSILSVRAMSWLIDTSMYLLFGWRSMNIRPRDRYQLFGHLYSTASVKQVAHWFQIMRAGRFQMFDDSPSGFSKARIIPAFPMKNNKVPKLLIMGMKDCLVEPEGMMAELSNATIIECKDYEHMDTIWANDADVKVFRPALEFIRKHLQSKEVRGSTRSLCDSDVFQWPVNR